MDLGVVLALVVGEVEVDVVSAAGDVEVLDDSLLLFVGEDLFALLHHGGVGGHVTRDGSDVCFDDRYSDFLSHRYTPIGRLIASLI